MTNRPSLTARPTPRALRRLGLLLALSSSLAVGGCAVMSPVQTDIPHLVSDGVNLDLGPDVGLRGVVVVADKKDGPGIVVGQVFNNTAESVQVRVGVDGANATTTVAAGESRTLSEKGSELKIEAVPVEPGQMVELQASVDGKGENVVNTPVLPAAGYYSADAN